MYGQFDMVVYVVRSSELNDFGILEGMSGTNNNTRQARGAHEAAAI